MSCDIGEVTERLENELAHSPIFPSLHLRYNSFFSIFPSLHLRHNSFFNPSVTLPTSQFILQPFRRFSYIITRSPTLPLLHQRHSSFSNPSFTSPTSEALHLSYSPGERPMQSMFKLLIIRWFLVIMMVIRAPGILWAKFPGIHLTVNGNPVKFSIRNFKTTENRIKVHCVRSNHVIPRSQWCSKID